MRSASSNGCAGRQSQNVPEALQSAAVPVAWLGRTSTDDAQDPTLSLPRQLDSCRKALPPGFVIVAKFYDVESGRTTVENRGRSNAHERLDIPIARDGSIADLLAEARPIAGSSRSWWSRSNASRG